MEKCKHFWRIKAGMMTDLFICKNCGVQARYFQFANGTYELNNLK